MEKKYRVFRYIAYSLELLLMFVLQSTPFLVPEVFGGKPLLLIPAALTIAFFEPELPAMAFGLAAGLLSDFAFGNTVGFYTLTMLTVCFVVSLVFRDYMVVSFFNAMAFTAAITAGLIILRFLFFYVFAGKSEPLWYFARHYLPRILYTIIMGVPLYFLNRFLYKSLR